MGDTATSRTGRLNASSLLESVLALGLLAGALSMAVLMHFRVLAGDRSSERVAAWAASEQAIAEGIGPGLGRTLSYNGFDVHVRSQGSGHGLHEVHIRCERAGVVVLQRSLIRPLP